MATGCWTPGCWWTWLARGCPHNPRRNALSASCTPPRERPPLPTCTPTSNPSHVPTATSPDLSPHTCHYHPGGWTCGGRPSGLSSAICTRRGQDLSPDPACWPPIPQQASRRGPRLACRSPQPHPAGDAREEERVSLHRPRQLHPLAGARAGAAIPVLQPPWGLGDLAHQPHGHPLHTCGHQVRGQGTGRATNSLS